MHDNADMPDYGEEDDIPIEETPSTSRSFKFPGGGLRISFGGIYCAFVVRTERAMRSEHRIVGRFDTRIVPIFEDSFAFWFAPERAELFQLVKAVTDGIAPPGALSDWLQEMPPNFGSGCLDLVLKVIPQLEFDTVEENTEK